MDHVHYDLAQVEAQMRGLRASLMPSILEAAEPADRSILELQDRFFEAQLAGHLEMVRLLNEGRSPHEVGHVVGVFVAAIVINALRASPGPETCWAQIIAALSRAIPALNGEADAGVVYGETEVIGTRGGRA